MCASRFSTRVTLTLPLLLVFLSLIDRVSAFGAGSIPNYTYLNGAQPINERFGFLNILQTKPSAMGTLKKFFQTS